MEVGVVPAAAVVMTDMYSRNKQQLKTFHQDRDSCEEMSEVNIANFANYRQLAAGIYLAGYCAESCKVETKTTKFQMESQFIESACSERLPLSCDFIAN